MTWTWLVELPSTNARIAVTLAVFVCTAVATLFCFVTGRALPDGFEAWLVFLAAMSGVDTLQFWAKRRTADVPPVTRSEVVTAEPVVPAPLPARGEQG